MGRINVTSIIFAGLSAPTICMVCFHWLAEKSIKLHSDAVCKMSQASALSITSSSGWCLVQESSDSDRARVATLAENCFAAAQQPQPQHAAFPIACFGEAHTFVMCPNVRGETITTQSEESSKGAPVLFVWGLLKGATHATFRRAKRTALSLLQKWL